MRASGGTRARQIGYSTAYAVLPRSERHTRTLAALPLLVRGGTRVASNARLAVLGAGVLQGAAR
eukprot:12331403-Alexandrium_andersonii.AAC.1